MSDHILKISRGRKTWFLVWSSVVDSPLCKGKLTVEACQNHFRKGIFADISLSELSHRPQDDEWLLKAIAKYNRAGVDETKLTIDQLIDMWCEDKGDIRGKEQK